MSAALPPVCPSTSIAFVSLDPNYEPRGAYMITAMRDRGSWLGREDGSIRSFALVRCASCWRPTSRSRRSPRDLGVNDGGLRREKALLTVSIQADDVALRGKHVTVRCRGDPRGVRARPARRRARAGRVSRSPEPPT